MLKNSNVIRLLSSAAAMNNARKMKKPAGKERRMSYADRRR